MAWIEVHQALTRHPKALNLAGMMEWPVREAVGTVVTFWLWCVDYAEDGDLRRYNDATLACAVGLDAQDGQRFVRAMVECGGEAASGFIERQPYFRVHDWWDYAGLGLQSKYRRNPMKWKRIRALYKDVSSTGPPKKVRLGQVRSGKKMEEGTGETKPDGFDLFWTQYPKKVGKGAALKSWNKLRPNQELKTKISLAIASQKQSYEWLKDNGQFIPNPATWLNQQRWDDELSQQNPEGQLSERTQRILRRGL